MTAYIPKAQREDWRTPAEVVALVRDLFGGHIQLDPCAAPDDADWLAERNFTGSEPSDDGLVGMWGACTVYCNPPFGDLRTWVAKCAAEAVDGAEVVLLMPARTDTKAWHEHVATSSAVCLWRGRMTFVGAPASCPFPVALVYWGPRIQRFREVFGPHGMVFRP